MSTNVLEIEGFQLSPQQTRVWELQRGGDGAYLVHCGIVAKGRLSTSALKGALERVVKRHEILRTTFQCLMGVDTPLQVIVDSGVRWADDDDWSELSHSEQEAQLQTLFQRGSLPKIDLVKGPIVQARVVKLSTSKQILLVTLPALCADSETLKNVVREIGRELAPHEYENDEVTLQYADFSAWQNEVASEQETEPDDELEPRLSSAKLAFEATSAGDVAFEPDVVSSKMSASVTKRIQELARDRQVQIPTFLMACWQILISRLASETEVLLGVSFDGRKYEELKSAMGLFARYLPVQTQVRGSSRFNEFLNNVELAWEHSYRNQEYFRPENLFPSDGKSSFFDYCFDFEDRSKDFAAADFSLSLYNQYVCLDRFKIKLTCILKADEIVVEAHYDSSMFQRRNIERLSDEFCSLVESAGNDPESLISDLDLLSPVEREQVLVQWNETSAEYPRETCIHELFEQQVERTPAATAVSFRGAELSYEELNARANQLAHYLRERGVSIGQPVGLCVERSLEMVIGMLGVLKAGGGYVPIDPEYPRERVSQMLGDAKVRLLLTQSHLTSRLPEHSAQVVRLDGDWEEIAQCPDTNLSGSATAENLAYMIYTSGSTGQPKGVMIPHRALSNHMAWMQRRFPLTAADRVVQKTPFSFDASVWEFYAPLLVGAQLVMAEPGGHADPAYLVQLIQEQKVTTLQLVPTLLERLLEEAGVEECSSLRRVFCGGEALSVSVTERFREKLGKEFVNLYGPTEVTIDSVYWQYEEQAGRSSIPIGKPVSNTQAYVLDEGMRVVPIGVAGELYLGGESLGHGYWQRAGLTADRFVPHPYSTIPGARLYRTGDVVRWNAAGELEYLGRNDHQVKIRGYRIETGEIETALLEREEVGRAVVLVREEDGRGKQLAAFVVSSNGVEPSSKELREYLQGRVPEYMVPASIAVVEELPLMPNGKVDRQALLALSKDTPGNQYEGARNEIEELLVQVWQEVLGLERVGIHDNFFELGGHSLLATQLISRIQILFQIELPIRTLFDAPAIAELGQEIEKILKGGTTTASLPLRPIPRRIELPLSFAQERLWFLDQLAPNNPFYNISAAMRINGALNEKALERSLSEIVKRHEVLRTTFTFADERPHQRINPPEDTPLPVIDLRGESPEEQSAHVLRLSKEEARTPFDLAQGPLLRASLLRLGEEESVLLLTMHHVVSDGWSMGILIRELTALYEAFQQGQPSPLPDLAIQYADFAVWQRSWLQGEALFRQMSYWKEQLAGLPPSLDLPTDHPRPEEQTFRGAIETLVFPKTLTEKIKALCQREEVTLYMFLLAAFQVLLSRYTGQSDIAVGSPIANRNRKDTEGLIGFFINTLVMRTDLSGNPSFQQVLKRVREVTLGAYANQDLPFERLVDELKPVRDLSRQPLFQVLFAFQNIPKTKLEVAGLTFSGVAVEKQTVQFDLNVAMAETDQGIACEWQYNTDLFEAPTIRRMLGNLESLFEAVVAKPEETIGNLEWLLKAEREQVLMKWNETSAEYQRETCIHELFEQQVERTPAATAVIFNGNELSYGELNARANQLAHYLRERGVSAGEPVGLCVERSLEMVVGMLGVLKAGGGYVPIDPEYPRERVSQMLGDSGVRLLLTQSHLTINLPSHAAVEVQLDEDWDEIAQCPDTNLSGGASAENLAYMIYTSGSTGQPKGVMIPHRALGNHMAWMQRRFPLTTTDRVIQKTPFSFDASVWEFYAPLLVGAQLVMAEPGEHADPAYLVQLIQEQKVTTLQLVPTLLERLLEEAGVEDCVSLRRVFCGGEALSVSLTERFREKLGKELVNLYGPTEVTIDSTYWESEAGRSSIPIGKPVSNTQAYVLDEAMRVAPIGVAGELYLGGESLAHGYWQRAGLTAERFVPHPYSTTPGARLYRTGDVVRWNAAGELEYFGRNDHQVKIRGYRIETGEIETALLEREEVGRAVVLVREEEGKKQLAAFVVSSNGVEPNSKDLREYLQGRVPEYMVPASIAVVGDLPLMPNGKVDRQALLALSKGTCTSEYEGARNNVEDLLVQVWQEVLGLERVGIHDNFFELGGDSIVSIQVIARMRQHGVKLKLKEMFQYQTIAELAQAANATEPEEKKVDEAIGMVALTPIQQLFFAQELANPHHFNQAVLLETDYCPEASVLEAVMQKLVAHHAALRLRFTETEAGWQQAYAETDEQPLVTVLDLSYLSEEEQRAKLEAEAAAAQASLNISDGPVLRVVLFDCGERGARLLLVIHHLVVDGVSWRILLEDLQTAYEQARRGEAIELPAATSTFKRWSESLAEYANSAEMEQEAEYWLRQGRGSIERLPVDYEAGENTVASGRSVEVKLSREETQALLQEVPKAYHTQIQEVLMTAMVVALRDWTGADQLLVDMEGHGREEVVGGVDVSRTVGWFTSIYPVQLEVNTNEPATALKSIKEQLRRVPERGIGYGVWRYLGAGTPAQEAEVSFNYLGQFDQVLSGGEFRAATESAGPTLSPYNKRPHLLAIGGMVGDGQLRMGWGYSEAVHRRETIERVAAQFADTLRALIAHCQSESAGGHTPSDFPLAQLDQQQLDSIEAKYSELQDVYPLTPLQQGVIFHSLYAPQSGLYVSQTSLRIRQLDKEAFQRAWQQVTDRHEILRTAFVAEGFKEPLQVVLSKVALTWHEEDWRDLSTAEAEQKLQAFLEWDRSKDYDFARAPMMRVALMQLAEDDYYFVWSHHHVIMDGWSMPLLINEVMAYYQAFSKGEELELAKPRPYRDYIAWLEQQDEEEAKRFWREEFKGIGAPTKLGIERTTLTGTATEKHVEYLHRLSEELTAQLRELGHREKITLNTIIQGAWALLLSRYSGESKVVFGTTVAGRPAELAGVESMVGVFINTLPLFVHVDESEEIASWLKQLQQKHVEIRHYEHSPLVKIQSWIDAPRGVPLFETLFSFQNYPVEETLAEEQQSGLDIQEVRTLETTNYPLTLVAAPSSQLLLRVNYQQERFQESAIARMLEHLSCLLESIVAGPEQTIGQLDLMPASEREQILDTWSDIVSAYPVDLCLHELFEQQVARTPEATALVHEQQRLSYRELNLRANQLAHHLRELGVGPEVRVAICMERGVEMVIGLLGVLKAGGVYVPIDPAYPRERVEYILNNSAVVAVMTQPQLAEKLAEHALPLVIVDPANRQIAQQPDTNLNARVTPENLAYIIYTSGSTGTPKGVMVTHQNVARLFAATDQWFNFNSSDVWTMFHSFAFDFSVWEIYGALLYGGRLVIVPYWISRSPEAFYELLAEEGVTVLNQTPSAFQQLMRVDEASDGMLDPELRLVIFGGEALELQSLQPWFERHGDEHPQLVNMYGITETTVHVTYRPLVTGDAQGGNGSVIGRPIHDLQTYILDEQFRPVPVGIAGEMYVGGAGVARGYVSRPDLAAQRFVPHPFSTTPGARLYRTGDLARWSDRGELEYLGRNDHQVKIRGFRIETGEIETALLERKEIGQAVVLVREEEGRGKQLAAYVVPSNGIEPSARELRSYLQERLPEYMVPASIAVLAALPLTSNGKIDRQSLLLLSESGWAESEYEGARNEVEEVLVQVWQEVLGLEQVGIHDNFFELGGDSIISIQIVGKARQLGLPLHVKQIFQHRTIAELASAVNFGSATEQTETKPDEAVGEVPLTPIQQRFFAQGLPNPHHFNQAVLLETDYCPEASVEAVMQKLVAHHAALRLRFTQTDSGWQQAYAEIDEQPLVTVIDLSQLVEEEQRAKLEAEAATAQASLNISDGPVLRVVLFDCGERGARLLLVIHHLVVDGVSWRILLEDLQTAYEQARRGEPIELPAATSTFKRWSESLAEYVNSAEMQQEAEYWLRQGRGSIERLPVDYEAGENTVASGRSVEVKLSREETQALLQEVPKAYHTQIQEVLMTAMAVALRDWTGADQLLVDMEGHGREEVVSGVDVSRTVGWFTSIYPVQLEVNTNEPATALKSIKEQLRRVPERGIGYGVWRYLGGGAAEREAEVSFNYLGQFDQVLSGGEFRAATESSGAAEDSHGKRDHLLAINGMVGDGQLRMSWGYSESVHRRETIERVAAQFAETLRQLIAESRVTKQQDNPLGQWFIGPVKRTNSLLTTIRSEGSNLPFFFASSYTDDPAFLFTDLAQKLGAEQPFYGLCVPHDEHFSYESLAAQHVEEIQQVQPVGPYVIGGYSLGGVVAFEIAQQLMAKQEEVALLVLLETVCPNLQRDLNSFDDAELAERIVRHHDFSFRVPESMRGLAVDDRLTYILDQLKAGNLVTPDKDILAFKAFLKTWRRRGDYTPQPYDGEILLFRTEGSSILNEHLLDMTAGGPDSMDSLGWNMVVTKPVKIIQAPGQHSNFIFLPHATSVAEKLRDHTQSLLENAASFELVEV